MAILALITSGNNYVGLGSRRGGGHPPPAGLEWPMCAPTNTNGCVTNGVQITSAEFYPDGATRSVDLHLVPSETFTRIHARTQVW